MKKHFSWITALFIAVSVFFGISCSQEVETEVDKTAPKEVTNFTVTVKDNTFYLSWINPDDTDFAGTQISMNPAEGILSTPISLGKDETSFSVSGLTVGKDYKFTIKTFDTNLNYSDGQTVVKRIENKTEDTTPEKPEDPDNPSDLVDTTPSVSVSNLNAVYDANTLSILVSWTNPTDLDFNGIEIYYGKTSTPRSEWLYFDKSCSSIVINDIEADDSEYSFSVNAIYGFKENMIANTTVIAKNDELLLLGDYSIGDILFTDGTRVKAENIQYGIPIEQKSKALGVVVGFNRYLGNPIIIGLNKSSSSSTWAQEGSVGYNTNFIEIKGTSTSGDMNGSDNWDYVCSIDPDGTQDASTNYPAFDFANTYGEFAGLTGTEYADGWYLPSIAELHKICKNKSVIQLALDVVDGFTIEKWDYYWSSTQCSLSNSSVYCMNLDSDYISETDKFLGEKVIVFLPVISESFKDYEYGVPEITSVEIPNVGSSYTDGIDIIINGKNFCGPDFDISKLYCSKSLSNIEVINAEKIKAIFYGNGYSEDVTVSIGTSSATGTLNYIKCNYSIGDILFTDGTIIKARDIGSGIPDSQKIKAFGVVAGFDKYLNAFIIGIQNTSFISWAPKGTTGYNTNFTEIQGTINSGDMYGADNWEYICSIDPEGIQDSATNYPAFNFANTYGQIAKLTETDYADGWYLPSLCELYEVYENKEKIETSLNAIGGFSLNKTTGFVYWSSSQSISSDKGASVIDMISGSIGGNYKYETFINSVLAIRVLTIEQFTKYKYVPEITSLELPTVGEGYTGDVLVTINGFFEKNFSKTELEYSLPLSDITKINDRKIQAKMYCNGYSENLTVTYGDSSVTGVLKVLNSSNCLTDNDIGKIVLIDGSFISTEKYKSYSKTPIAVIIGHKYNGGQAIAIGLKKGTDLLWARYGSQGYYTNFIEIQKEDEDGSDNWDYICSVDWTGTYTESEIANNYPVFNFALNYAEIAELTTTKFTEGWYVPSISELVDVVENHSVIQDSLDVVGGFLINSNSTMHYWSSTQSSSYDECVYYTNCVYQDDNNITSKATRGDVLVLRAFDVQ